MSLEQILNTGKNYLQVSHVLEGLKKDYTNENNLKGFLDYTMQAGEPLTEEAIQELAEGFKKNPFQFRQVAETSQKEEQDSLVDLVSKDYRAVVDGLSDKVVPGVALQIPDKDKKFYEIKEYLEKGDLKAVQKAYSETFDNHVWRTFIATADTEFIAKFAEKYIAIKQGRFLREKGIIRETVKDGKKVRELDYAKAREYIKRTIAGYSTEDERKNAYLMLGKIYAISRPQEEREQKDKSKKSEEENNGDEE